MWVPPAKLYRAAFAVVFSVLVSIAIASYVMSDRFATSEECGHPYPRSHLLGEEPDRGDQRG